MSIPITNIKLNKNTEFQAVFQEYVFFKFLNIFYCISYNTLFIPQISQEAEFIFLLFWYLTIIMENITIKNLHLQDNYKLIN